MQSSLRQCCLQQIKIRFCHNAARVLQNAQKRTIVSRLCLVSYFIIISKEVLRSTRVGTADLWYICMTSDIFHIHATGIKDCMK